MSDVQVRKNSNGSWSVYTDGRMVSDHRTYDGAATSANQHIEAAALGVSEIKS